MSTDRKSVDVVVVGAGTAGSAAAFMLADAGLDVALLEARPLAQAGPQWIATVVPWAFDRAGLPKPKPPVVLSEGDRCSILDVNGRIHLTVDPSPAWSLNLPLFAAQLREMAQKSGVRCFDRVTLSDVRFEGDRPVSLDVVRRGEDGEDGERLTFDARLFIDATGLNGGLRRRVPLLARDCPRVPGHHLCTAAQELCRVDDRSGAAAFIEARGGRPDEVLAATGVDGGFSTMWVHVDHALETVDLLTGAIADGKHASGPQMVRDFKARHPWVGERLSGGSALIPLRRPYDRLSGPGVALIGNAACQVFSAHGSGVGNGLIAARLLTDAVTQASDPGAPETTWAYQAAFHRELGALLAVYDMFRRFSQSLSEAGVSRLLGSGAAVPSLYEAIMAQRIPRPGLRDLVTAIRSSVNTPAKSMRMAAMLPRMAAAHALYRQHPLKPSNPKLRVWSAAVARVFGESADIGSRASRNVDARHRRRTSP